MKIFLFLILLTFPCAATEVAAGQQALDYVRALPTDTKIYVWPTKLQPYEIIGDGDGHLLASIVSEFNGSHHELSLVGGLFPVPLLSIFAYFGDRPNDLAQFRSQSALPASYKQVISSLRMDYEGCVFTSFLDRDTWADGGVIFVDQARLGTPLLQRQCVEAGLDYIAGFPTAPHLDYKQFPSEDIRRLVIDAILTCSAQGRSHEAQPEQSRDGLTALPKLGCVVDELSK